jgi:NAD(P)-dependent dehydrogenase (short-subunit alcohol dehydrogenase family)
LPAAARRRRIGNGRAAAILLARAGTRVLVVDRDARWPSAPAMIAAEGGTAAAHQPTSPTAQARQMVAALDRFAASILDKNVGIGSRGSVVDESLTLRRVMQVNVEPMFPGTRSPP